MSFRNNYMDALTSLSCFAVIMLHCTTVVFANRGDQEWFVSVALQSVFLFAVPVFFMISGANLLGYRDRYTTKTFFLKRFKRVVVTLVGYSALYYLIGCFWPETFGQPERQLSLYGFVDGLFTNGICDVYWFFYAIIALYLMTPILSLLTERKRLFEYALILSVVSTVVIPMLNRFMPTNDLFAQFTVPYLSGYIMYYLLGYYLVHFTADIKRPLVLVAVGVCCVLVVAFMTIRTNLPHTVASGAFEGYDSFYASAEGLLIAIMSACLFMVFRHFEPKFREMGKQRHLIRKISSLSLGVYAVHMLVINTINAHIAHNLLWDVAIKPFVVFGISLVLSWLISLISSSLKKLAGDILPSLRV